MDVQQLIYNVTGQELYLDVPEGRVTSITGVSVFGWSAGDDSTAESATTGSASNDSVNTTFDGGAGKSQANPRLCPVAATTNVVVGRQYLAIGSSNEHEWVEVTEVDSGVSVKVRAPLQNDYVSGDGFVGTRISISLADAWIEDVTNVTDSSQPNPGWRVRWEYVVTPPGGVAQTIVRYTYADVVRQPGEHNVSPADMERYVGSWSNLLPPGHRDDQGRGLIDEGYQRLRMDLLAIDVPHQQMRNQDVVDELVKASTSMLLQKIRMLNGTSDGVAYEFAEKEYNSLLDRTVRIETHTAIATDGSGASSYPSVGGVWSR